MNFGDHLANSQFYLQYPVFDENGTGVVFSAVSLPIKKLGLNFCLNHQTYLYYCSEPKFGKDDVPEAAAGFIKSLNNEDFVGM